MPAVQYIKLWFLQILHSVLFWTRSILKFRQWTRWLTLLPRWQIPASFTRSHWISPQSMLRLASGNIIVVKAWNNIIEGRNKALLGWRSHTRTSLIHPRGHISGGGANSSVYLWRHRSPGNKTRGKQTCQRCHWSCFSTSTWGEENVRRSSEGNSAV